MYGRERAIMNVGYFIYAIVLNYEISGRGNGMHFLKFGPAVNCFVYVKESVLQARPIFIHLF